MKNCLILWVNLSLKTERANKVNCARILKRMQSKCNSLTNKQFCSNYWMWESFDFFFEWNMAYEREVIRHSTINSLWTMCNVRYIRNHTTLFLCASIYIYFRLLLFSFFVCLANRALCTLQFVKPQIFPRIAVYTHAYERYVTICLVAVWLAGFWSFFLLRLWLHHHHHHQQQHYYYLQKPKRRRWSNRTTAFAEYHIRSLNHVFILW